MENAEEIFHFLEDFSKRKPKTIPQELNEYLAYVARTGDPVYQWSLVKSLFKEKLLSVITDFYETSPGVDIPPYPNVDPFNYDIMKNSLLERLDSFTSAPFTVQRICELLTYPRKQYNRVDKFMRAIEKNILVVSTREPGTQRHAEPENGEPVEPVVNGSDNNSEYNVDVEMEDMSWKENAEQQTISEPQPGSSDAHISVDDIEARLKAKQETPMDTQDKTATQYESVTPPELNVSAEEQPAETKTSDEPSPQATVSAEEPKVEATTSSRSRDDEPKVDVDMKPEASTPALIIPEIKVDDAEMTEQRLNEQSSTDIKVQETIETSHKETASSEPKTEIEAQPVAMDENSSDSTTKEDNEPKLISEVSTSSEESSSSSDNTDGSSNSPKTDERHIDVQEESSQSDTPSEENVVKESEQIPDLTPEQPAEEPPPKVEIQSDNYSISDVNSELPQPPADGPKTEEVIEEKKEPEKIEESKSDVTKTETEPNKES
ncbi:unnamed protein product [Chrysodeixis includens]|uniref:Serine/threonine-protein phosphatase 4 regulatory subunit 2 n=1 Tax=Chrysodeixis includens TaxID=689277 RepID=A0A9P0C5A4_CHRIL|nr:unnamed protein product [Chrysodeixis includens]CAH0625543.1 unnamed protein product [Chrysodeixis includens]